MKDLTKVVKCDSKIVTRLEDQELRYWGYRDPKHAGMFLVKSNYSRQELRVIATNGDGWDHISVSLVNRCPMWEEMEQVKRIFMEPFEIAYQLHVATSDHINCHPFTLHLWRSHKERVPLPPAVMV